MDRTPTEALAPESAPSFNLADEVARENARYLANAERFREEQRKKFAADTADYEAFAKIAKAAIRKHGVWNVLAAFPDLLRERGDEEPGEDEPESAKDYKFVAEFVEAILPATDLCYDEDRSSESKRKEAMGAALIALGQVKP